VGQEKFRAGFYDFVSRPGPRETPGGCPWSVQGYDFFVYLEVGGLQQHMHLQPRSGGHGIAALVPDELNCPLGGGGFIEKIFSETTALLFLRSFVFSSIDFYIQVPIAASNLYAHVIEQ